VASPEAVAVAEEAEAGNILLEKAVPERERLFYVQDERAECIYGTSDIKGIYRRHQYCVS
jgi:hypothetical protein